MDKKRKQFKSEADWLVYQDTERERLRVTMKSKYEDRKSRGVCYKCGAPCLINFSTGKPYHACAKCRISESQRERKRRNGGMADT